MDRPLPGFGRLAERLCDVQVGERRDVPSALEMATSPATPLLRSDRKRLAMAVGVLAKLDEVA